MHNNFKSLSLSDLIEFIDKIGLEKALKEHERLFLSLGGREVEELIEHYRLESISKFHEVGLLEKLDVWRIPELIKDLGIESISKLGGFNLLENLSRGSVTSLIKDLGVESMPKFNEFGLLEKLGGRDIECLIKHFALESVEKFNEFGLLEKLSGWGIRDLIKHFGLESVEKFHETGLLGKLDSWHIKGLIKHFGLESISKFNEFGLLEKFHETGLLGRMDSWYIENLIKHLGVESISKFNEFGLLKKLGEWEIEGLTEHFGIDSIRPLIADGTTINSILWTDFVQENIDSIIESEVMFYKDDLGFSFGYHLFQTPEGKKRLFDYDLNKFMPGEAGVIHDFLYNFYYHDRSFNHKIAFVLQGPDHNGALSRSNLPHILYQKGYNVLVVDGRIFGDQCGLQNLKYTRFKAFTENEGIPFDKKLDLFVIESHGKTYRNGRHYIDIPQIKDSIINSTEYPGYGVSSYTAVTSEFIKTLTCNVKHPLNILITSCYGWSSVDDSMPYLPEGSEMVAVGKYVKKDGVEEIVHHNAPASRKFEKDFLAAEHLNAHNGNSISSKDIALIYSLKSGVDRDMAGIVFYAKKHALSHSNVICEDEAKKVQARCHSDSTISKFVEHICVEDEVCEQKYSAILGESLNSGNIVEQLGYEAQNTVNAFGCWLAFEDVI